MSKIIKDIVAYEGNSEHGRSTIILNCPFCNNKVEAYKWSISGCGKKCSCGAKFYICYSRGYVCEKKVESEAE
ncbi:MAG: hypothetical protein PHV37_01865 [Candidatus Gastranaerophilales bacterium]|nr:hypothetical protein [Candidatus Gastranaerophilales bacterium]